MTTSPKHDLLRLIGRGKSYDEIAEDVVKTCAKVMDTDICTLWRRYEDQDGRPGLRLMASIGIVEPKTLAQEVTYKIDPDANSFDGLTSRVASKREVVRVNSFEELTRLYGRDHAGKMDNMQWRGQPDTLMHNLLAMPIAMGGLVVGVLKVENRRDGKPFFERDEDVLRELLEPISVFCKALLLMDEQEQRLIESPTRFIETLLTPYDPKQVTQDIVDMIAKTLNAQVCSLWLKANDEAGEYLVHEANYGVRMGAQDVPRYRLPRDPNDTDDKDIGGITAWVAARSEPFWANSYEELTQHDAWRGKWDQNVWGARAEQSFRSMYAVPLLWQNELLGVLKVENPQDKHHFTASDQQKCRLLANLVVLVLVISRQMRVLLLPEMAHILKSPVAGLVENLIGAQDELEDERLDREALQSYVQFATTAAMTVDVISRTLSVQMLGHSDDISRDDVYLGDLVEQWAGYTRRMVPSAITVHVVRTTNPKLPLSPVEKTWVEMAVYNLMHNAVKYSPDNGVVDVNLLESTEGHVLTVEDQGPGILDEDLPRVFEPAFKRKAPNWPEGTGLGLYTLRSTLDRLGWSSAAQNRSHGGARFTILIPNGWRGVDA